MRSWKADYDNRLRSTLDSAPSPSAPPSTTASSSNNVAIEQSKILKELDLGKKKEEEKGGVL